MPTDSPPLRLVLQLQRESLSLSYRLRDGSRRTLGSRLASPADPASVLHALVQQAGPELLGGRKTGSLEILLVNERPLSRLLRGELPTVTLLATAGVHEALHAALAAEPPPNPPGTLGTLGMGTRSPTDPCFALVGDASELWPGRENLSPLCPTAQLLAVDERLAADGSILQALTQETRTSLVAQVRALSAPAAVVLLHSMRNPQHEEKILSDLHAAGLMAVSSSSQIPAHRGGLDERLRVRAAVLGAALSPGCAADLAAVEAGLATALPAFLRRRFLLPRPDGTCAPVGKVPPWQLLLAPVAMTLRGALATSTGGADTRFFFLAAPAPTGDRTAEPRGATEQAAPDEPLAVAAVCHPGPAAWPPSASALCLGLPCELPATCVALAETASDALHRTQSLAAAYGFTPAAATSPPATLPPADLTPADPTPADPTPETSDGDGSSLPVVTQDLRSTVADGALSAPLRYELAQLLCAEASGAQESGLLAAALRHLGAAQSGDAASPTASDCANSGTASDAGGDAHTSPPSGGRSPGDWTADLRYQGQAGILSLRGVGTGGSAASAATDLVVRFVAEHERVYGFSLPQCPVELLQVRLTARS
jgi:hypothetical protein